MPGLNQRQPLAAIAAAVCILVSCFGAYSLGIQALPITTEAGSANTSTSAPVSAPLEQKVPSSHVEAITALVRAEQENRGWVGVSVAVVKQGEMIYSNAFGFADLKTSSTATTQTMFRLGSVSKPITAVATMKLAEQGKLQLNAPVQKYVPSFPTHALPVTCMQLLSHTGGIRHYRGQEHKSTRRHDNMMSSLDIFIDDPFLHDPGTTFSYSSYGYVLLGAAVESAAGQSFVSYVANEVFKPAGMDNTLADNSRTSLPLLAKGYIRNESMRLYEPASSDLSGRIPAGGYCSNAEDIAKFAIALQRNTILSTASRQLMWEPQVTSTGEKIRYGLGWQLANRGDTWDVYHSGTADGYESILLTVPEKEIAVVLLTNVSNSRLFAVADKIARMVER